MSRARHALVVAVGTSVLVGLNVVSYRGTLVATAEDVELTVLRADGDAHQPPEGVLPLRWSDLGETRRGADTRPVFSSAVTAKAGRTVEVSGYAFLLRAGVKEGRVTELVVMPPSMSGCCGPACTPVLEKLMYVDCSDAPLPRALWKQTGLYARFTGVLRLSEPDAMGCLFTLRQARARLYDVDTDGARASMVFDGTRSPPWRRPEGT